MSFGLVEGLGCCPSTIFHIIRGGSCLRISRYLSDNVIYVTYLALQYPLYTIMAFDEWRNGIPVAFFVISRTREQDLDPVLQALHHRVQSIKTDWCPSSIILDNAQAEINTLRYPKPSGPSCMGHLSHICISYVQC